MPQSLLPLPLLRRGTLFALAILCGTMVFARTALALPSFNVELPADRDNTLFQTTLGDRSNGAGPFVFSGSANSGAARRGLLHFDVAGNVPAGATIQAASLRLSLIDVAAADASPRNMSLRRVQANWGEGTSNSGSGSGSGGGATSTPNDATWLHRFHNTSFWTSPGGDFSATQSASQSVGITPADHTWGSTAGTVNDVQFWLDNPSSNFGWLLFTDDPTLGTVRRFGSREHATAALRPLLSITYELADAPGPAVVPEPGSLALWGGAAALVACCVALRRRR